MFKSERTFKIHFKKGCPEIILGFGFRVVALDSYFRKDNIDAIISSYLSFKIHNILFNMMTTIPRMTIRLTQSAAIIPLKESGSLLV